MDAFKRAFPELLKSHPDAEVEFRFGRKGIRSFDTNIARDRFEAVLKRLKSNKKWSSTTEETFEDRLHPAGGRTRVLSDGKVESIRKERVYKQDLAFPSAWADVRVCIAHERPLPPGGDPPVVNTIRKRRWRFVHKGLWAFDLTRSVAERPLDPDDESLEYHGIELELVNRSKPAGYLADYGEVLVKDILGMIGLKD
jgi:hypothetical protein